MYLYGRVSAFKIKIGMLMCLLKLRIINENEATDIEYHMRIEEESRRYYKPNC